MDGLAINKTTANKEETEVLIYKSGVYELNADLTNKCLSAEEKRYYKMLQQRNSKNSSKHSEDNKNK